MTEPAVGVQGRAPGVPINLTNSPDFGAPLGVASAQSIYKYRCIKRCTANYGAMSRLFEQDQEVIWNIEQDGVPSYHFIPLDGGPATVDPEPARRKQRLADAARRDSAANLTGEAMTLKQLQDQQAGNAQTQKVLQAALADKHDAEVRLQRIENGFGDAVDEAVGKRMEALEAGNAQAIKDAVASALAELTTPATAADTPADPPTPDTPGDPPAAAGRGRVRGK